MALWSGVTSLTAADTTMTVAGTSIAPTVAVNAIGESLVTSLTTDLAAKVPTTRTITAGTGLTGGGDLSANRTLAAAVVLSPPQTITYAATVTLDATTGNNFKITATGALTLAVPTGGVDGQTITVEVLASGANRVVTLNASILLTSGQGATYTIVSAKVGFLVFRFSALSGSVWACLSQTQEL